MRKSKTKDTDLHRAAAALGSRGGKASAARLTPEQRTARASEAGNARWGKTRRYCLTCGNAWFGGLYSLCPHCYPANGGG